MYPFHERLARIGLAAAAPYGFCLAGGYAVQAHGMVDRPSKDVDDLLCGQLLGWAEEISG